MITRTTQELRFGDVVLWLFAASGVALVFGTRPGQRARTRIVRVDQDDGGELQAMSRDPARAAAARVSVFLLPEMDQAVARASRVNNVASRFATGTRRCTKRTGRPYGGHRALGFAVGGRVPETFTRPVNPRRWSDEGQPEKNTRRTPTRQSKARRNCGGHIGIKFAELPESDSEQGPRFEHDDAAPQAVMRLAAEPSRIEIARPPPNSAPHDQQEDEPHHHGLEASQAGEATTTTIMASPISLPASR